MSYGLYLRIVLAVLVAGICAGLIRAMIGPRNADRIVGINMIGSLTILTIAVLSVVLEEAWLLDVCLIYCMISFLAVVVLARISIAQKLQEEEKND